MMTSFGNLVVVRDTNSLSKPTFGPHGQGLCMTNVYFMNKLIISLKVRNYCKFILCHYHSCIIKKSSQENRVGM